MADAVVRSPGVGTVIEVLVTRGAVVAAGEEVAVIESMQVEIPVTAPRAGRVVAVAVGAGDQVQAGDVLLTLAHDA
jgi:biotin carboxyl carrier protein